MTDAASERADARPPKAGSYAWLGIFLVLALVVASAGMLAGVYDDAFTGEGSRVSTDQALGFLLVGTGIVAFVLLVAMFRLPGTVKRVTAWVGEQQAAESASTERGWRNAVADSAMRHGAALDEVKADVRSVRDDLPLRIDERLHAERDAVRHELDDRLGVVAVVAQERAEDAAKPLRLALDALRSDVDDLQERVDGVTAAIQHPDRSAKRLEQEVQALQREVHRNAWRVTTAEPGPEPDDGARARLAAVQYIVRDRVEALAATDASFARAMGDIDAEIYALSGDLDLRLGVVASAVERAALQVSEDIAGAVAAARHGAHARIEPSGTHPEGAPEAPNLDAARGHLDHMHETLKRETRDLHNTLRQRTGRIGALVEAALVEAEGEARQHPGVERVRTGLELLIDEVEQGSRRLVARVDEERSRFQAEIPARFREQGQASGAAPSGSFADVKRGPEGVLERSDALLESVVRETRQATRDIAGGAVGRLAEIQYTVYRELARARNMEDEGPALAATAVAALELGALRRELAELRASVERAGRQEPAMDRSSIARMEQRLDFLEASARQRQEQFAESARQDNERVRRLFDEHNASSLERLDRFEQRLDDVQAEVAVGARHAEPVLEETSTPPHRVYATFGAMLAVVLGGIGVWALYVLTAPGAVATRTAWLVAGASVVAIAGALLALVFTVSGTFLRERRRDEILRRSR